MGAKQDSSLDGYKALLINRQQELWRVCSETLDGRQTVDADSTSAGRLSRATALQSQALAQETDRRRQAELKRIASALHRLEDGEFGYCVVCGDEIAVERLRMDPAVATCIDCARRG